MAVKVSAYCRVSTSKDDQVNSFEAQKKFFDKHIFEHEDYELFYIYADEGRSGTKMRRRDQFIKLLTDAGLDVEMYKGEYIIRLSDREPLFNLILIKDVTRFARDILSIEAIRKLRDKKVYINFITLNKSTEQMSDDFVISLFTLLGEEESRNKSISVSWGKERSAEAGRLNTADKFYGYKLNKEDDMLEIVEHEAEVIRQIYQLYVNGKGLRLIIQWLNENNIRTRQGKAFGQTTINRMLSNPAYKGWLVRNKFDSPKIFTSQTTAKLKPESEWQVHEGRIPAIVDEQLFDLAQDIRKSKKNHENRKGKKVFQSEYAGSIICKVCGSTYVKNREPRNGREFYNCKTKKHKGKSHCTSANLPFEFIDQCINQMAKSDYANFFTVAKERYVHFLDNIVIPKLEAKIDADMKDVVIELEKQKFELEAKRQRVSDAYIDGGIVQSRFKEQTAEINEQIERIDEEIRQNSLNNDEIEQLISQVKQSIVDIHNVEVKDTYSIEEIKSNISSIEVYPPIQMAGSKTQFISWVRFKMSEFDKLHNLSKWEDTIPFNEMTTIPFRLQSYMR